MRIGAAFVLLAALAGAPARAADDIDDPKVARRLGVRIDWQGAIAPLSPPAVGSGPGAPASAPPVTSSVPLPAPAESEEDAVPLLHASRRPVFVAPRAKLASRRFSFFQLGASTARDGRADAETFDSVAIDVYPISSLLRVGLSTQFGWQAESGVLSTSGDYFAAESLSVGAQLLGNRVVPFAETFGGVGYMRRLQFDRTVPTAYFQFGVDVGAEVYLGPVGYLSVALGYLRPINGFAVQQTFVTAFVDSWSFKLGVGL
jgi:hypothetical protein